MAEEVVVEMIMEAEMVDVVVVLVPGVETLALVEQVARVEMVELALAVELVVLEVEELNQILEIVVLLVTEVMVERDILQQF
jgi:hypothetical protein